MVIDNPEQYKSWFFPTVEDPANKNSKIVVASNDVPDVASLKVGDPLPTNNRGFYVIKRKGDDFFYLTQEKRSRSPEITDEVLKSSFTRFIQNLSQDRIDDAKKVLKATRKDAELEYRAVYHSFKMYLAKESTITLARAMLVLLGDNPISEDIAGYDLLDQLRNNHVNSLLIRLFSDTIETFFYPDRNKASAWTEDIQRLYGAYHLFQRALEFIILVSEDLLNEKGIFFPKGRFLDWHEAGAMCIWEPLGYFRSRIHENIFVVELVKQKNRRRYFFRLYHLIKKIFLR